MIELGIHTIGGCELLTESIVVEEEMFSSTYHHYVINSFQATSF